MKILPNKCSLCPTFKAATDIHFEILEQKNLNEAILQHMSAGHFEIFALIEPQTSVEIRPLLNLCTRNSGQKVGRRGRELGEL